MDYLINLMCLALGAGLTELTKLIVRKVVGSSEDRVHDANTSLNEKLRVAGEEHARLQEENGAQNETIQSLAQEQQRLENTLATSKQQLAKRDEEINSLRGKIGEQTDDSQRLQAQVKEALKLEGQIWTQKPSQAVPEFIPLMERSIPIVSVLNLKGGVGKTTTTAHLAATYARQGIRVLIVDLDLQGSLTSLLVTNTEIREQDKSQKLLRHYFHASIQDPRTNIADFAFPVLNNKAHLVGTSDQLAYSEMNLTFEWLINYKSTSKHAGQLYDVRFMLRRGLHQRDRDDFPFDLVLLDCPPLINLSCVNALAASDFVLIPVVPSRKAIERVPPLLARLRQIRQSIHSDLQILGILATRTHYADKFSRNETFFWDQLNKLTHLYWGTPIGMLETFIPTRVAVRDAEDNFTAGAEQKDLKLVFSKLIRELNGKFPPNVRFASHAHAMA